MSNHSQFTYRKTNIGGESACSNAREVTFLAFCQKTKDLSTAKQMKAQLLILACTINGGPISLVSLQGFKNFHPTMNAEYRMPVCTAIISDITSHVYETCKAEMIEYLSDSSVSLITHTVDST